MVAQVKSNRPQALVYCDTSQDSLKAIQLLTSKGVKFELLINGIDVKSDPKNCEAVFPSLDSLEGEFIGLERIKEWIEFVFNRPD